VCPVHVFPNVKKEEINIFLQFKTHEPRSLLFRLWPNRLWSADVAV
jgi:hypothetical protein